MENIVQQCSYMYLIPVVSCSSFAPWSTRKAWSRKATCGKTGGSFEQASSLPNVFFFFRTRCPPSFSVKGERHCLENSFERSKSSLWPWALFREQYFLLNLYAAMPHRQGAMLGRDGERRWALDISSTRKRCSQQRPSWQGNADR